MLSAALRLYRRFSWWDALFVLPCSFALWHALQTTAGLPWPYDPDHFRDIAAAQTAIDGAPLADPYYLGETIWYNPLVSWIVAAGSAATNTPAPVFHARAGPYLNLVAPIGIYVLSAALFGRLAAVSSATTLIFLSCGKEPSWACASYSPWLFAANFAQGLFYLALVALVRADSRRSLHAFAWAGVAAGLTFLSHTAPAVVLAIIALMLLVTRRDRAEALRHGLVMSSAAALVAAPFLWSIVWRYRLRVLNRAPMEWSWLPLTPDGFPSLLRQNTGIAMALALAGLTFVVWQRRRVQTLVVTAWGLSTTILIAMWLLRYIRRDWHVPAILPGIHYWFYLKALLAVLAGVGMSSAVGFIPRPWLRNVVAVSVLFFFVWSQLPTFVMRDDLYFTRYLALGRGSAQAEVTHIIRRTTRPSDVFLASRGVALLIVGPAGRKTVAVQSEFSNPYVDYESRARDRDRMFEALKRGELDDFRRLADRYSVTHVIALGVDECGSLRHGGWRGGEGVLFPTFEVDDICLFDIK